MSKSPSPSRPRASKPSRRKTHVKPRHGKPSPIASAVLNDSIEELAIAALVEMSGGPVEPSRAALASLFGSIDWRALGAETLQSIFLTIVRALDEAPDASRRVGDELLTAWRQYRADLAEHTLAQGLRLYLKCEVSDRTVRDVIAMCRAGHVRRLGGDS